MKFWILHILRSLSIPSLIFIFRNKNTITCIQSFCIVDNFKAKALFFFHNSKQLFCKSKGSHSLFKSLCLYKSLSVKCLAPPENFSGSKGSYFLSILSPYTQFSFRLIQFSSGAYCVCVSSLTLCVSLTLSINDARISSTSAAHRA